MSVTKDVNLGTIMAVGLFLVGQTLAGVWWASKITEQVTGIVRELNTVNIVNQRQWDRIAVQDNTIQTVIGNDRATQALMTSVKADVSLLRESIQENNALIRDMLIKEREAK